MKSKKEEKIKLTVKDAYSAMFNFLDEYYKRTGKPDEIGGLLGEMSLLSVNPVETADPAAWEDWLDSVNKVRSGVPIDIELKLVK